MEIIVGAAVGVALLLGVGVYVWWSCRPTLPPPSPLPPTPQPILEKSFLPSGAAELSGCVLAGTFLGEMAGPALDGLLAAGEAVPFLGEVCKVLMLLKKHADDLADEGEEYWRLSVWCVGMLGSFSRLGKDIDDAMKRQSNNLLVDEGLKRILKEAARAVQELFNLVNTHHSQSNKGVAGLVYVFWTSGVYLDKAKVA